MKVCTDDDKRKEAGPSSKYKQTIVEELVVGGLNNNMYCTMVQFGSIWRS